MRKAFDNWNGSGFESTRSVDNVACLAFFLMFLFCVMGMDWCDRDDLLEGTFGIAATGFLQGFVGASSCDCFALNEYWTG